MEYVSSFLPARTHRHRNENLKADHFVRRIYDSVSHSERVSRSRRLHPRDDDRSEEIRRLYDREIDRPPFRWLKTDLRFGT